MRGDVEGGASVVLGLLSEEPLYGYDLLERFRALFMGFLGRDRQGVRLSGASPVGARRTDHGALARRTGGARSPRVPDHEGGPRAVDARPRGTRRGAGTVRDGRRLALGSVHLLSATDARKAVDAREVAIRDLLDAHQDASAAITADKGPGRTVSRSLTSNDRSRWRRPNSRGSRLPGGDRLDPPIGSVMVDEHTDQRTCGVGDRG